MKKPFSAVRFLKLLVPVLALLVAGTMGANAQIISADRVIDWTHVGVRGGIPVRTNLIVVTRAPYGADNTGARDASVAIQSAINSASSNDVVYFPDGIYLLSNAISCRKSYITLRGHTNSVLLGVGSGLCLMAIGVDRQNPTTYTITNGATKGSTNLWLSTTPSTFSAGDQITITENTTTLGTTNFPVISVHQNDNAIGQQVIVGSITGNQITISDPLIFDFTNGPLVTDCGISGYKKIGLENLVISGSNDVTHATGAYSFMVYMPMCQDSWVANCSILYPNNYGLYLTSASHVTITHNTIARAISGGSNHSGLLVESDGGCLIQDNIFSDGLQPGIEFNTWFCGNAIFGNFFTNNVVDIDCHNTHPMMNLWEANIVQGYFEMDGYFGSASHQTLLRNAIQSTYIPLLFKRWTTYMNVVGNVLGSAAGSYAQYTTEANNPIGGMIVQFGYPNIGNNSYIGTNPPTAWNYPSGSYPAQDAAGELYPAPIFTLTSNQGPTKVISGNFNNITARIASLGGSVYSLVFQDNVNTNLYYPTNGIVYATTAGTTKSVILNRSITVKAGWKVFITGQSSYQQLQQNDKFTDTITGNYDYYNHSVTWDTNGAQAIPTSLLYPDGTPAWWGTNRWPAVDPISLPVVTVIPAQYRYINGIDPQTDQDTSQGSPPPTSLVPPFDLQTIPQ